MNASTIFLSFTHKNALVSAHAFTIAKGNSGGIHSSYGAGVGPRKAYTCKTLRQYELNTHVRP